MTIRPWLHVREGHHPKVEQRPLALMLVELVTGLSAIGGGIGLLGDWIGMSPSALDGTPFASFTIPALILIVVVGGSLLGAALLGWRRHPVAPSASLAAGAILLGWIAVETVWVDVPGSRPLQIVIGLVSLVILALTWRWQRQGAD